MFYTFEQDWDGARDATNPNDVINATVPKGRHEVERIPNPLGLEGDWLVLKGTRIGAVQPAWPDNPIWGVTIEE